MKRTLLTMLILSLAALLTVSLVHAQKKEEAKPAKKEEAKAMKKEEGGKEVSVTGEVVDLKCLIGMNMKGADHKGCAMKCAQSGHATAILEGEGEKEMIYIPVGQIGDKSVNDLLKEHAGGKVTIKGSVVKKGGSTFLVAKSLEKAM